MKLVKVSVGLVSASVNPLYVSVKLVKVSEKQVEVSAKLPCNGGFLFSNRRIIGRSNTHAASVGYCAQAGPGHSMEETFGDDDEGLLASIDLDNIVVNHYKKRAPSSGFTTASVLLQPSTPQGSRFNAPPSQSTVSHSCLDPGCSVPSLSNSISIQNIRYVFFSHAAPLQRRQP